MKIEKKDLKLSDHLAVKRTELANYRTLLAYLRTGLMFFVSGLTIIKFLDKAIWFYLGFSLFFISLFIIIIGIIIFRKTNKSFKDII